MRIPGACARGPAITPIGSRDAPHGKLCANCPLTWVVARFGSFNFMFYQYLVPFPPRSRRRAGNPVKNA